MLLKCLESPLNTKSECHNLPSTLEHEVAILFSLLGTDAVTKLGWLLKLYKPRRMQSQGNEIKVRISFLLVQLKS